MKNYYSKTTLGNVRSRGTKVTVMSSIAGLPPRRQVIEGGSVTLAMLFNGGKVAHTHTASAVMDVEQMIAFLEG